MTNPVFTRINKEITQHAIVLYMHGTPMFPLDSKSAAITLCLASHNAAYQYINLLDEPDLRNAVTEFSQCPTFPQLFINGKFFAGGPTLHIATRNNEVKAHLEANGLLGN